MPDRIGDALLHDAVDNVLLILIEMPEVRVEFRPDRYAGRPFGTVDQFIKRIFEIHIFERVRVQRFHRVSDINDSRPCHLRDRAQLLFGRLGSDIHQHDARLDSGNNSCEGVPQRVVDFSGQPVSLPCFRHSRGLVCVLLELFICSLELSVQKDNSLLLAHLREDKDHHVEDKDKHIDQAQHIQYAQKAAHVVRSVVSPNVLKGNRPDPVLHYVPVHEQVKHGHRQNIHGPLLPVNRVAHDICQKKDDHTCISEPRDVADRDGDSEFQDQLADQFRMVVALHGKQKKETCKHQDP